MSGGLRSADHLLRPQADRSASEQAGATAAAGPEPAADQRLIPAMSSWGRAFPGVPRQVKVARHFVASLLDGSSLRDDAVIVLSELFTNALQHTCSGQPGGLVVVQVSRWRQGVRIAVSDQGSAQRPVIKNVRAAHDGATCVNANMPPLGALPGEGLADGVLADRLLTDRLLAGGMFADDVLTHGADKIPADCGRGLYMVSCLAEYLDWHDDAGGRTVHAVLGRLQAGLSRGAGQPDRAVGKPSARPQQFQGHRPAARRGERPPFAEQDRQHDQFKPVERAGRLDGPDAAHQVNIAFRSA